MSLILFYHTFLFLPQEKKGVVLDQAQKEAEQVTKLEKLLSMVREPTDSKKS